MALHKKLSRKPRTDLNTELTDYDLATLPNPTNGPFECEEHYLNIYDLDFFTINKLAEVQHKFRAKIISKIGLESFNKIELGLRAYVSSSKSNSRDLQILKKSINNWRPNLFVEFQKELSEADIQHLKPLDLEKFSNAEYFKIDSKELIPEDHLKEYQKLASKVSVQYLKKYVRHCKKNPGSLIKELDDISFFRGYNNKNYYNKADRKSDIFSHYASATNEQKEIFFERTIFTSYSICLKTAELFMVAFGSRRRALVDASFDSIKHRIFSSFIVSASFYRNQFEFLALPSAKPLLIFREFDNGDMSSFKLLSSDLPNKQVL